MNDYIFIDLDGVILDSEERMLERKDYLGINDFNEFFEYTNKYPEEWDYIIRKANSINNSVEIIKELEESKEKIAILTKIHTLYEMKTKVEDLRTNRNITCPIFFVPSGIKKHQVVNPNCQLLIDDSKINIDDWIKNGGNGLIFDPTISKNTNIKVKSLEFLLKK